MKYAFHLNSLLVAALTLPACGGGGDSAAVTPVPSPGSIAGGYSARLLAGHVSASAAAQSGVDLGCTQATAAQGARLAFAAGAPLPLAVANTGDVLTVGQARVGCGGLGPAMTVQMLRTGDTTLLPAGVQAAYGSASDGQVLQGFVQPRALAVAPAGDVYVADGPLPAAASALDMARNVPGKGPGIWRLRAGGAAELVAGAVLGQSTADGVGAQAGFASPQAMCWGQDGALYVADDGRIRRVQPATQQVQTLPNVADSGDFGAATLACGPDGEVLQVQGYALGYGGAASVVVKNLHTGESFTVPPGRLKTAEVLAWSGAASQNLLLRKTYGLGTDGLYWRHLPTGQSTLLAKFAGNPVNGQMEGGVPVIAPAESAAVLSERVVLVRTAHGVVRLERD